MRIYHVSLITPGQVGGELYAQLSVDRHGRKIWDNGHGEPQVFCDEAQKRLIEEAVERYPHQARLSVGCCLVQRSFP
jgi:hypothetical protein